MQVRQSAGLLLKNNLKNQYAATTEELRQYIKASNTIILADPLHRPVWAAYCHVKQQYFHPRPRGPVLPDILLLRRKRPQDRSCDYSVCLSFLQQAENEPQNHLIKSVR